MVWYGAVCCDWCGVVGVVWVVWYGVVWYGMVWYGMAWYGMVWYGMVWYGMVWYGMVWYGMVWYGMVWYGMVWYGMVWYGMVLYGVVWYGMVWYGMVWYGEVGWGGVRYRHKLTKKFVRREYWGIPQNITGGASFYFACHTHQCKMAATKSVLGKKFLGSVRCFCGVNRLSRRYASTDASLRPRRSLLYIPGNDERKIKKASSLNADIVVLDCEDGVALNRKVYWEH